MMTAPAYFGDAEYESFRHRCSQHQHSLGYHDRHGPYSYYNRPRHVLSVDYDDYGPRAMTRVPIHESEPEAAGVSARKRIAVAVR